MVKAWCKKNFNINKEGNANKKNQTSDPFEYWVKLYEKQVSDYKATEERSLYSNRYTNIAITYGFKSTL